MSQTRTRRRHLNLLRLEQRLTPTVYLVHTNADNGSNSSPIPGSLREAINTVNGGFHDEIQFDMFFTPGMTKISLVAPLLPFAKLCKFGGGTMPGMLPIEINGSGLPAGASGLTYTAGGTLKGVAITGFPDVGVNVVGSGFVSIEACSIGFNLAGTTPVPNKGGGIALSTSGNAVKSNLISANGKEGIMIVGPGSNLVTGNTIGLNAAGTMPAPNSGNGIRIESSPGNTIGGAGALGNVIAGNGTNGILIAGKASTSTIIKGNTIGNATAGNSLDGIAVIDAPSTIIGGKAAGEGNVISNNKSNGIQLMGMGGLTPADPGALIEGNVIGTNAAGTVDLGNGFDGIRITGLHNNIIGGDAAGAGNLIAGNDAAGINIGAGNKNTAKGNRIGLNAAGTDAIPNTFAGVAIASAMNTVGGITATARNIISGNTGVGVILSGTSAKDNTIAGNWIGIAADGVSAAGNKSFGILVNGNASKNFIGGTTVAAGNVIAFNGESHKLKGHGVVIASGVENTIRLNSIYDNYGRGIDLGSANAADAVTINSEGDADDGANRLQDYPVVVSRPYGTSADATWQLNSLANSTYTLDFYSNDKADPSGFGEGKTYLGSGTVITDVQGNGWYEAKFGGKLVSALATDTLGNTSEFSMIDSDADGLADRWETHGIDVDESSDPAAFVADLMLTGASDMHKDLFVEIDAMTGFAPTQKTLDDLVAAFAAAPNSLVHNPDGIAGVTLHLTPLAEMDSSITPTSIDLGPGPNYSEWTQFDAIKNPNRGTVAQRGLTNYAQIKTALDWTHRYCLFAESYSNTQSSGIARGFGVSDFMVTLPSGSWGGLTASDRAGTFMHELGHTLNLRHGGHEHTQYKPNYISVMNYAWQFPDAIRRTVAPGLASYASSWQLDYSRSKLPSLNENSLDETLGLQGTPGRVMPYGKGNASGAITSVMLGSQSGPVDWTDGGGAVTTNAKADINFDDIYTTLEGHEDWSILRFYVLEKPLLLPGQTDDEPEDEHNQTSTPPTKVQEVTINGSDPQRSRVLSIEITFDDYVELPGMPETAFRLRRNTDGLDVGLKAAVASTATSTAVTLTFDGALVDSGSIEDGRYTLTIFSSKVSNIFGELDGNGDNAAGGDYVLASADAPNPPTNIFRQFGDANGDGFTDLSDFLSFRSANGSDSTSVNWNRAFDSNDDGGIDLVDFIAFRQRLGMTP